MVFNFILKTAAGFNYGKFLKNCLEQFRYADYTIHFYNSKFMKSKKEFKYFQYECAISVLIPAGKKQI